MNQEKQREAYEKMLKKCPDILTPMKANRWSPVGKNTIYAALKNGEIESYTYKGGYIFTKRTPSSITSSRPQTIKVNAIQSEVRRNVEQLTASAIGRAGAMCLTYQ